MQITRLDDVLDVDLLNKHIAEKHVRVQTHPEFPTLAIANYSNSAVYDGVWDNVTRQCRGLIYDTVTKEVLARPFQKFWSAEQLEGRPDLGIIPWWSEYRVFEKLDGSLIIGHYRPDGTFALATRGSFTSDQAIKANEIWQSKYSEAESLLHPWFTYIWEVIYPQNRIVVDYGGEENLTYLGRVHIPTGYSEFDNGIPTFPIAKEYKAESLEHLMEQPDEGREGFVLWWPKEDFRIKCKFETYKALHGILTQANTKTVWRACMDGVPVSDLELPDEFQSALERITGAFQADFGALLAESKLLCARAQQFELRKDQALFIKSAGSPRCIQSAAFALLDGKSCDMILWKALEPTQAMPIWEANQEDE
jgi:RNA ligase